MMTGIEPVVINESGLSAEEVRQLRHMGFEVAEQGSEAWLEERLGKATSSRIFDVIDWTKGSKPLKDGSVTTPPQPKEAYYKYARELVAERIIGKAKRFISSKPMAWGTEHEEEAATIYSEKYPERIVRTVGFIEVPNMETGTSLDRTVDEDRTLEIKCPNSDTLIEYIENGIPPKYYAQMQHQMWVAKKSGGDFMAHDPELDKQYYEEVERDEPYIKDMVEKLQGFLAYVDRLEEKVRAYVS